MADALLDRVVAHFTRTEAWRFRKPEDRHAVAFVRRRADLLRTRYPGWLDDPDLRRLTGRLRSELGEVRAYLAFKLGTRRARGPLYGGHDSQTPNHLDVANVAWRKTSEPPTTTEEALATPDTEVRRRAVRYLDLRKTRVTSIVWRATAMHDQLWAESGDKLSAILVVRRLNELLDRRLRTIERMNLNVASHKSMGGDSGLSLTGKTGPWLDGFRVRMFEYPRVPNSAAYRAVLGDEIAPDPENFLYDGVHDWAPSDDRERLNYNVGLPPGPFFRVPLRNSIVQHPGSVPDPEAIIRSWYRLRLVPAGGITPAHFMDQLFTPDINWWRRTWMFCDHVIAALHLEALLLALRRRSGSDALFDGLITGKPPGYLSFCGLFGDRGDLLGDDPNDHTYFDNTEIPLEDLQPGDHVLFWNSPLYKIISDGDWHLENTIIMDVDSDETTGGVHLTGLIMQGHGTGLRRYPAYQDEIADHLRKAMIRVRRKIANRPAGATEVVFKTTPTSSGPEVVRLVKWTPYGSFLAPGAWWVEIDAAPLGGVANALDRISKSVADDPAPLAGYTHPPSSSAVYFPVYEPQVSIDIGGRRVTGWQAYFARLRANASFTVPRKLKEVVIDGTIMPGLFPDRSVSTIEVVRPRVIL